MTQQHDHQYITPESALTSLLMRYGVTPGMQSAASRFLSSKPQTSRYAYRRDLILAGLTAAGAYILGTVAGMRPKVWEVLAIGAGLMLLLKLLDKSTPTATPSDCEALLFLTRYGTDFQTLAHQLRDADPALADDLRNVIIAGTADPTTLSDYSILHLWECVRVRAEECDREVARALQLSE